MVFDEALQGFESSNDDEWEMCCSGTNQFLQKERNMYLMNQHDAGTLLDAVIENILE